MSNDNEGPEMIVLMKCDLCKHNDEHVYSENREWIHRYSCIHTLSDGGRKLGESNITPEWCPLYKEGLRGLANKILEDLTK